MLFDVGPPDAGVVEISWEKYFYEFERAGLAFVYRDTGPAGELDDFHRLVYRCTVPQLVVSGRSTIMIDWL
ncbi:hypothetical protein [Bradyrhizobium cenepequi]|uniref:hypothetical protein n=1 Tax=Bradyrhizobium cenepequi TaxID=2821403 RepID=UPI001CE26615|nr:hypothetical protein [Bradyrhizobium cenepequi]MCA6112582.1 hypothetical protein [Bradyrhizobium cenepequi]